MCLGELCPIGVGCVVRFWPSGRGGVRLAVSGRMVRRRWEVRGRCWLRVVVAREARHLRCSLRWARSGLARRALLLLLLLLLVG